MVIVLLVTLLPLGSALLLLTQVVEFLTWPKAVVVTGVIHKRLPCLAGSLLIGGSVIRVRIGLMSKGKVHLYRAKHRH